MEFGKKFNRDMTARIGGIITATIVTIASLAAASCGMQQKSLLQHAGPFSVAFCCSSLQSTTIVLQYCLLLSPPAPSSVQGVLQCVMICNSIAIIELHSVFPLDKQSNNLYFGLKQRRAFYINFIIIILC